ncbi:SH3 domain-binding glutamic acid-rich-like protein 3 [Clarias gariepinus]|uniref:SH3 domain-binding glutamic acid-rich-like protein 3 n=1 Tax=Clarias gariepinus TaxID=13013 RepID=UPI00234C286D|nr:SH3 domain-binding glutamic acid-rich-like protein 3 [Clarias gariepinus]
MSITIYFSSVSGSREVKDQQNKIFQYLDSKNIKYFAKDITQNTELKDEMRQKTGNPKALTPQVFNGNKYCGDYQAFFDAVEDGKPETFFKL